jgi:hypothetical protein
MGYGHKRVYHSANICVEGPASTNTLESFWSIAKNGIRGSNRHVGSHYLQDYLNAYAFRWNRRRNGASMFHEDFFAASGFEADANAATAARRNRLEISPE